MKPKALQKPKNGFALVVTIGMMVLLTIVVVATLSLSTITLRTVGQDSAQAVARANARLALMVAIGQLQKEAGPDQRVTGTADLEDARQNPSWTGVWRAGQGITDSTPVWLVSGSNPDPSTTLNDRNSALLAASPTSDPSRQELRAPFVEVGRSEDGKKTYGRYAYATLDEGVKVRVDVAAPAEDERGENLKKYERIGRSQSPSEPGFAAFDSKHKEMWAGFDTEYSGAVDRRILASMGTVALAAKSAGGLKRSDIPSFYFNDLTTGGFGLPVNVRDGGMKKDLSLILDRSQQGKAFVGSFLGATPTKVTPPAQGLVVGTTVYGFSNPDKVKFSLSQSITNSYTGTGFVGPNWGTLYNYARLWETVQGSKSPMIGLYPRVDSELRQSNWAPYREVFKTEEFKRDLQHQNSGLSPVMSLAQIGFGIKMAQVGTSGPYNVPVYSPIITVKPIVGLWNPYNVHIDQALYQLEWAMAPVLHWKTPATTSTPANPNNKYFFLRNYWAVSGDAGLEFPTDAPGNGNGAYFRLRTSLVDFQPGEVRYFSVEGSSAEMTADNPIVPRLNPLGYFNVTLYQNPNATSGKLRYAIPSGTRIDIVGLDMQDTHPDYVQMAQIEFPGIGLNAANTWFTLKAGLNGYETHLNRYTDLWNGGKGGTATAEVIPEAINSSGQSYSVDSLATPQHLGTWRFYTRNSTEAVGDQGARGWIDANPRVMSNNFRMDGSTNTSAKQGWNVSSNLLGWANNGSMGDGKGGNRGLVQQGGSYSTTIPDGSVLGDRWQGLTGPASTTEGEGLSHVIVYDVPQAPLTSIGQFQHANLSRYNFEPGFVVGNSYANLRIPLGSTVKNNFGGLGFNVVDISYEANEKLWDTVFFSTLAPDYKGGGSSFDQAFDRKALLLRRKSLPNPRMVYTELPGDTSIDKIISDAGGNAPQTIATRILIEGAFNVNSTSKTAWKAVLSTMDGSELPVISPTATGDPKYTTPKGIRFSRFNHPIMAGGFTGGGYDPSYWQGWRELSNAELERLADAIVREVKDRGPFRSMAAFVNRDLNGSPAQQRKGALQAAIDSAINGAAGSDIASPAVNPPGQNFNNNVISNEIQSAGHAGYLLQGDILQCLAPIMQVRSDYFRIRTCGEAIDRNGKVLARAWCEAFIQRLPEYLSPEDRPEAPLDKGIPSDPYAKESLRSEVNKKFGRKMQMISFRWLNPSEI